MEVVFILEHLLDILQHRSGAIELSQADSVRFPILVT
jgi:hypothetical protein